jgi:hypothetical protein
VPDTGGRSGGVVHPPQGALLGKELRQRHQAKCLRIAQIVVLGGDGQLMHMLDGLKVVGDEFETTKQHLVVGMRSEQERRSEAARPEKTAGLFARLRRFSNMQAATLRS